LVKKEPNNASETVMNLQGKKIGKLNWFGLRKCYLGELINQLSFKKKKEEELLMGREGGGGGDREGEIERN